MSPGATFERIYCALKDQLGSGRYAAGEHLDPVRVAFELNSSITPVRDALHRLVGERLAEAPRNNGFRVPLMTEMGLRNLYAWNAKLLILAARPVRGQPPPPVSGEDRELSLIGYTERIFAAIAAATNNPEHAGTVERVSDRLRAARHVEIGLIGDTRAELEQIDRARLDRDFARLRKSLGLYHRRRERLAAEIVAGLLLSR